MDNASESPHSFSELILLGPGKTKAQEIMKVVASVHRVPGDLENLTSSHSEIPDKVSADDFRRVGQPYAQREEVLADGGHHDMVPARVGGLQDPC